MQLYNSFTFTECAAPLSFTGHCPPPGPLLKRHREEKGNEMRKERARDRPSKGQEEKSMKGRGGEEEEG